ncbi:MAG: glycosyl hydrolase family 65 protein [Actinomycetota bacterium]
MRAKQAPEALPQHRFPVDPWRLTEAEYSMEDHGLTETLFAVGNGFIGMRANPEEGREAHSHATILNGFHETWPISHAESAYGFAEVGQTIVNAPDAKLIKLYVDDEPLILASADLASYERSLDFRTGVLTRDVLWRTPAGKRVRVRSERMVTFEHRHLAVLSFEVTLLDDSAPVVISSQLLNRQDGSDEYYVKAAALGEGLDPRKARKFDHRVLQPLEQRHDGDDLVLGYRCTNSGMTVAAGYRHLFETACEHTVENSIDPEKARTVFTVEGEVGKPIRIEKLVAYHTSTGVPPAELADRCQRTLTRAARTGTAALRREQAEWLDAYWQHTDVEIEGDDPAQQAIRWNLFQMAQASARTQEQGIAAKGVTADGYEGHYFWDTEVYVIPFLAYTQPETARKLLRFRWKMLDAARKRARTLDQRGALYPWRTINGEEASAYYAAGTAQYHINAAVAFALKRYVDATDDWDFLGTEGAEILVETARLWEDLGFYGNNGDTSFHIHGVTGPDEYTTVKNDNTYTNVMARFNLRFAAGVCRDLAQRMPEAYAALERRTGITTDEIDAFDRAADAMWIPFDAELGINPQDDAFLSLEPWDFDAVEDDKYPLLLNFHPLVIYRYQVLKQADVVLATFLRSSQFSLEQKRRNFDYYDPITTGDSSLSACVQSIMAAEVGHHDLALEYFRSSLFLDLADTHRNTADGVHIANAGGAWAGTVYGFAGFYDPGSDRPDQPITFSPRLPATWRRLAFSLFRHGRHIRVELTHDATTVSVEGEPVEVCVHGETRTVTAAEPVQYPST